MTTHLRHPDRIDVTLCKCVIFNDWHKKEYRKRKKIITTTNPDGVTCPRCLARLRVINKKKTIIQVLNESPKPPEVLGRQVGMYKLNSFIADLKAAGIIRRNQATNCLELANSSIMTKTE